METNKCSAVSEDKNTLRRAGKCLYYIFHEIIIGLDSNRFRKDFDNHPKINLILSTFGRIIINSGDLFGLVVFSGSIVLGCRNKLNKLFCSSLFLCFLSIDK